MFWKNDVSPKNNAIINSNATEIVVAFLHHSGGDGSYKNVCKLTFENVKNFAHPGGKWVVETVAVDDPEKFTETINNANCIIMRDFNGGCAYFAPVGFEVPGMDGNWLDIGV